MSQREKYTRWATSEHRHDLSKSLLILLHVVDGLSGHVNICRHSNTRTSLTHLCFASGMRRCGQPQRTVRANFKKPVPRTFHLENHMRAGKLTTVLLFGLIPYFNYWWNDRSPIFRHHIPPSNDHPS